MVEQIAGTYPQFSIHERAARISAFYTSFNFLIGIVVAASMRMGILFLFFQMFSTVVYAGIYFLLVRKRHVNQVVLAQIAVISIGYLLFWFFTGGLYGPALVSSLVIFYVLFNMAPEKYKYYSGAYVLTVVAITLLINFEFPEWVKDYPKSNEAYLHYFILVLQFAGYFLMIETSAYACYDYEQNLALQKNKELENSNDAKLKLLAIVSHDLRGPMATLKAIINSVDEGFSTPEKTQRQLSHLKTMTEPLNNTLNNLLLWSRQQLEGLNANIEPLKVEELLKVEVLLAAETAKLKDVEIINRVPTQVQVYADINHLRIIFRNLLSNAVRFANAHSLVEIYCQNFESEVVFSITNTGEEIPLAVAQNFNRSGQMLINTEHSKQKPQGLGLQVCRDFVVANRGKIWIKADTESKTVFCFSIPIVKAVADKK